MIIFRNVITFDRYLIYLPWFRTLRFIIRKWLKLVISSLFKLEGLFFNLLFKNFTVSTNFFCSIRCLLDVFLSFFILVILVRRNKLVVDIIFINIFIFAWKYNLANDRTFYLQITCFSFPLTCLFIFSFTLV